ncbi:efflux RND transporter permease subunit [Hymenobacter sp. BT770]|uniref:efflux RND transporter permease subunit n=1 Tax=Hymenobacter sp. BT770 TaxID=2886942 RepID=UPI001D0FB267|nr:efflux RND transporter permease subunit [Hymenobacter sp. BT770]MCC3152294.1 efflux RND transporter permease subunit [Hymenobacter sp. BT770]MDO3414107.1 efflux RND transporter permease subunit [Hymenobacter sp. BT770]
MPRTSPFQAYKAPITVLLVLALALGTVAYRRINVALFPEVTFPKVKVIAENGLQPVDRMMVTVTKPMEDAIKRVPGLKLLRSTTSRGSCEISAFLDWGANVATSQTLIESRLNQIRADLPATVQITVERMNPAILPVMGYTLEAPGKSALELRKLALYTIKPFLSQVDGVSSVQIQGGRTKEYQVQLLPDQMAALGLGPDDITKALTATNFVQSNGYLSDYRRLYLTVTDATILQKEDLENIVLRNDGRRIVRLTDVATVNLGEQQEYIRINANGSDAVLISILRQPDANVVLVSDGVRAKVAALRAGLPSGVKLAPYYDQADFVAEVVRSVQDALWIGLALALVVTALFLRSVKATLTILGAIPVALALTVAVLYFVLGYSFNIMTLGAIAAAIGLMIDDAVVMVEQLHRVREDHPYESAGEVVRRSVGHLLPALVGSSLSTIVIFLPFALLGGVAGAYFKVLATTMVVALLCSFFVAWLGLPVIYLLLSRKMKGEKAEAPDDIDADDAFNQVSGEGGAALPPKTDSNHHEIPWVRAVIRHPAYSIIGIVVLIGSMVLIIPRLATGFLPEMDEGAIVLDYHSPPGTGLEETDRMLRQAEKLIAKVPEVASYSRRTGTQMGFFITEPNSGDYLIRLKTDRKRTTEEVISDIRQRVEATQPALTIDFGQVIGDMLGDLMSTVQPIEIKVFGPDAAKRYALADQVTAVVEKVAGTADVFNGIVRMGPSVDVRPDPRRLAQFGLTATDFQTQLQTQLVGTTAGSVLEGEQLLNIRLRYPNAAQATLEQLRAEPVFLPNGQRRRVDELATVRVTPSEAELERENLQAMTAVTARLDNRDLGSAMSEIRQKLEKQVPLPPGYFIQYGGSYAEQQKSFQELLTILGSACLLVFAVGLFLFRDLKAAGLILLVAILGPAGGSLALFLTNTPLNVGSYTGLIMVVGIIGENAIFTFQQFNEARAEAPVEQAIGYAIAARLRPKLMTAFSAIAALLPLALGIGAGAQLHQPLAIAVIGGLLLALPLLLVVLPSLLRMAYRQKQQVALVSAA